jgi:hypothetical protein
MHAVLKLTECIIASKKKKKKKDDNFMYEI